MVKVDIETGYKDNGASKQIEQLKENVQDTTQSIEELQDATKDLSDEQKKANKATKEAGKAADDTKKKFDNAGKSTKLLSKGLRGIGTAMKAAGIGLIVSAIAALTSVFSQNQKVLDTVTTGMNFLQIAFNDLFKFVSSNLGAVTGYFKALFDDPVQSIKDFGTAIKNNLIERFNSFLDTLGFVASAVKKVFAGYFKGALDDVKNAGKELVDVATGVDGSFDKIVDTTLSATEAIKEYTTSTYDAAKGLTQMRNDAQLAAAAQQGLLEKFERQAEQQRQLRDDTSSSIKDRIAANDELLGVLDKQSEAMLELADLQIAAAQADLAANDSIENQVKLIEARNNKLAVQKNIETQLSEQKRNTVALEKELLALEQGRTQAAAQLNIDRKRFNAEQITDDEARITALRAVLEEEKAIELERLEAKRNAFTQGTQDYENAQMELDAKKEEFRQSEILLDKEAADTKIATEQLILDQKKKNLAMVAGLTNQAAELAGKETSQGKAVATAAALINTYSGMSEIWGKKSEAPTVATSLAQKIASSALVLSTGLKTVKSINSVKVPHSKGGGAASPRIAAPTFNMVGQSPATRNDIASQTETQIQNNNNNPVRAYVVSTDVSDQQAMDREIEGQSSL